MKGCTVKNRLFETFTSLLVFEKNNESSHDLKQFLGEKIELSLRNQEPVIGILDTCDNTSVELLICGHSFMIHLSDILGVRSI
jgi:hypothetical protein